MDIKEIRELIQAVCESGIADLELERTGVKAVSYSHLTLPTKA